MKKFIYSVVITGLVFGLGLGQVRGADTSRAELNARVTEVNRRVKSENKMQTAMHAVSIETGVPLEQVEAMHKNHPNAGPAGILLACVLADETKKSPDEFLKKHLSDQGWTNLAKDSHVSLDKLHERLDHLDRALNSSGDKSEKKKK